VHKFERYLRHGMTSVLTAYLPITFGSNVPAVLIHPDGSLVGIGSLLSADPTRVVAKRYILTGHPCKVNKRTATIRYMFFNSPDVDYFKPVQLRTKSGRIGHIRESLGTHGYFKAGFDGPIDQMDTICLNLYKRCFPKWGKIDGDLSGDAGTKEDGMGQEEAPQLVDDVVMA
jgi:pre-rRNA-processing protein TSR1